MSSRVQDRMVLETMDAGIEKREEEFRALDEGPVWYTFVVKWSLLFIKGVNKWQNCTQR